MNSRMRTLKTYCCRVLCLLLLPLAAHAEPVSGVYSEGLIIAVDKQSKQLTGYYKNYSGWDERFSAPRFSCIFFLEGKLSPVSPIKIRSEYPGNSDPESVITGNLYWTHSSSSLSIKLPSEHGGCWNVQPFARSKVLFELEEKKPWIAIRVVKADKAYFYQKPNELNRRKAYIIKDDVIMILKQQHHWLFAEYINTDSGRITRGWIKSTDLIRLTAMAPLRK